MRAVPVPEMRLRRFLIEVICWGPRIWRLHDHRAILMITVAAEKMKVRHRRARLRNNSSMDVTLLGVVDLGPHVTLFYSLSQ